jgi:hypothetical protein
MPLEEGRPPYPLKDARKEKKSPCFQAQLFNLDEEGQ